MEFILPEKQLLSVANSYSALTLRSAGILNPSVRFTSLSGVLTLTCFRYTGDFPFDISFKIVKGKAVLYAISPKKHLVILNNNLGLPNIDQLTEKGHYRVRLVAERSDGQVVLSQRENMLSPE